MTSYGKVVLVGAGPGEMGLLTIKGQEYLKQADCIVYDRLLNKEMLDLAPINCEKIFVGKANHLHTVPQDKINELLFEKAKDYSLVVRLKGGDPYVFGRGGEEAIFLKERGVEVEVVPGISSSIAALSAAGIPITHRGLSKGFQVITAHSKKDELADIDYTQLLDPDVTYVFLMGLAHVGEIASGLMNAGRTSDTPAAVISSGTTNHQKKVVGTLSDIGELVEKANLESPAIIVVGNVVTLSDELSFFEKRPLFGKKYFLPVINRFDYHLAKQIKHSSLNELEQELIKLGAEVVTVTAGTISPVIANLDFLNSLEKEDYLVFTSANGVKGFFWNLYEQAGLDARGIGNCKIAAIGKKTAELVREFGFNADFVPKEQNGKALALELNEIIPMNKKVYWMCQKDASEDFESYLSSENLTKIVCYENVEAKVEDSERIVSEIASCNASIFTSGSNAKFAIKHFKCVLPDEIISIGPACSKTIKSLGFDVITEAEISSYEGIIKSTIL